MTISLTTTDSVRKWYEEAIRQGVDARIAYVGTELIVGWKNYWGQEISSSDLDKMIKFALTCPEAALHRWSIVAGPRPWLPDDSLLSELGENPRFSMIDVLEKQGVQIRKPK